MADVSRGKGQGAVTPLQLGLVVLMLLLAGAGIAIGFGTQSRHGAAGAPSTASQRSSTTTAAEPVATTTPGMNESEFVLLATGWLKATTALSEEDDKFQVVTTAGFTDIGKPTTPEEQAISGGSTASGSQQAEQQALSELGLSSTSPEAQQLNSEVAAAQSGAPGQSIQAEEHAWKKGVAGVWGAGVTGMMAVLGTFTATISKMPWPAPVQPSVNAVLSAATQWTAALGRLETALSKVTGATAVTLTSQESAAVGGYQSLATAAKAITTALRSVKVAG